ncbi:hypothetical protein [Thauera sp.]|uniref:hypothetical protein n=1 Tax=Thauera sp. TaxID=1905334 RepID=UPI00259061C7|nr:hypothetical protein [Thauera sp.]
MSLLYRRGCSVESRIENRIEGEWRFYRIRLAVGRRSGGGLRGGIGRVRQMEIGNLEVEPDTCGRFFRPPAAEGEECLPGPLGAFSCL